MLKMQFYNFYDFHILFITFFHDGVRLEEGYQGIFCCYLLQLTSSLNMRLRNPKKHVTKPLHPPLPSPPHFRFLSRHFTA